jgi:hypothetical protein
MNHQQEGDPTKLAGALLQLAQATNRPMRFVAGQDAVHVVENVVLTKRHEDLNAWRDLSRSLRVSS